MDIDKVILKVYMEKQKTWIANTISKEKNGLVGQIQPYFKSYYKTIVINMM